MRIIRTQSAWALAMLSVCFCMFFTGCNVMRLRVITLAGTDLNAEPNTSTIEAGVTTRAEVAQQFILFDTGWKGERLFFGRWLESGFTVSPARWGGSSPCSGPDRTWTGRNLVVEFDEQGRVISYQVLSDKELLVQLPGLLSAEEHLPELRQRKDATLVKINNVTGKELIDIFAREDRPAKRPAWRAQITPEQVERVDPDRILCPEPVDFGLVIHLKGEIQQELYETRENNRRVKTLRLRADVPTIAMLVYFVDMSSISTTK